MQSLTVEAGSQPAPVTYRATARAVQQQEGREANHSPGRNRRDRRRWATGDDRRALFCGVV